jgi:hypothetical protein
MAPHDDHRPAALLARVRWGNLARLAAIAGAGVLIALGPRGCGGGAEELPELPVEPPARVPAPRPAVTPPTAAERPADPRERRAKRSPRRKRQRRKRHPSIHRAAPSRAVPAVPAVPVAPPAPAPRRRPPAPRTPEFL